MFADGLRQLLCKGHLTPKVAEKHYSTGRLCPKSLGLCWLLTVIIFFGLWWHKYNLFYLHCLLHYVCHFSFFYELLRRIAAVRHHLHWLHMQRSYLQIWSHSKIVGRPIYLVTLLNHSQEMHCVNKLDSLDEHISRKSDESNKIRKKSKVWMECQIW